jgi:hypothetical protein
MICQQWRVVSRAYQVAELGGATSEDEDDTGAAARVAVLEIVAGAAADELTGLESRVLGCGKGRGRGGEKSGGNRELHCDYWLLCD